MALATAPGTRRPPLLSSTDAWDAAEQRIRDARMELSAAKRAWAALPRAPFDLIDPEIREAEKPLPEEAGDYARLAELDAAIVTARAVIDEVHASFAERNRPRFGIPQITLDDDPAFDEGRRILRALKSERWDLYRFLRAARKDRVAALMVARSEARRTARSEAVLEAAGGRALVDELRARLGDLAMVN